MNRSRLTPTNVVNKNGIMTTVHKRMDRGGAIVPTVLPAPATLHLNENSLVEAEATVGAALIDVQMDETLDHDIGDFRVLERRLAQWDPSVIHAYSKVLRECTDYGYERFAASVLHNSHKSGEAAYLLLAVQEDENPDSDWSALDAGTYTYDRAKMINVGIMLLGGELGIEFPENPFDTEDAEAVRIYRALAAVTYAVYHSGNGRSLSGISTVDGDGITLNNSGLIELIIRRPKDADRIGAIMNSRDNPESALIEEMLDAEASAMSDGIL